MIYLDYKSHQLLLSTLITLINMCEFINIPEAVGDLRAT